MFDRAAHALDARLRARLTDWENAGLLRTLAPPAGIDLSSNDYLQLSSHPDVVSRFAEAVRQAGAGSTGSRLLRGEREAFARVERRFAALKQTERLLFFSSGYLANLAVLTTLPEVGDVLFSDARNHASLIDGSRLSRATTVVFPHNDVAALARALRSSDAVLPFVVVESLFSMDGDMAPLVDYAEVCAACGAALIVDEAHAVGIYGERGSGLIEAAGIEAMVTASINTAGKALGVAGAFVAGSASVISYMTQRARPFVFSTAPPPALADALEASLDLVGAEPERRLRVQRLSSHLRARLAAHGVDVLPGSSQILSVIVGDNDRAFGLVVAAVSKSKFWPQTAIFCVEDDAQNGPDHVDAHRTIAFVASPYARRGVRDSTLYSTSSMLRTMELILGLKPMSQFDAAAMPMFRSFQARADLRPYQARLANVDVNERNKKTAWGASQSARMDFTKEDAADDLVLNEIIWKAVRGADSVMPPPVRASFMFALDSDDEEDSLTNDNKIHFIINFFLEGLRLVAIWSNNDDINQIEKNKHIMLEK